MQVVGYRTATPKTDPALVVATSGVVSSIALESDERLDYGLESRHCAGVVAEDSHEACDNEEAPRCAIHTHRWPCARCRGTCSMPLEACHEEHVVYLAAFAPDTFKVGVTRTWRLETRLREQGADRAARIRTVPNGRRARAIEADLATDLTDRVDVREKVRGIHRTVDEGAWNGLLDSFDVEDRFDFEYGFSLDRQPVPATLASGTVIGTKGRVLVLRRAGTTYAVDMRDLVGYELGDGGAEENHQSSLRVFE